MFSQKTKSDYLFKNDFKVGVFSFINSTFDLNYERMVAENKSLVLRGTVKWLDNGWEKEIGGMGELQYRYYLIQFGKNENYPFKIGFYAAPYAFIKTLQDNNAEIGYYGEIYNDQLGIYEPYSYDVKEINYISYGAGIYGGIKALIMKKITMDFTVGGGLKISEHDSDLPEHYSWTIFEDGYSGIVPRANFTLGFLF